MCVVIRVVDIHIHGRVIGEGAMLNVGYQPLVVSAWCPLPHKPYLSVGVGGAGKVLRVAGILVGQSIIHDCPTDHTVAVRVNFDGHL